MRLLFKNPPEVRDAIHRIVPADIEGDGTRIAICYGCPPALSLCIGLSGNFGDIDNIDHRYGACRVEPVAYMIDRHRCVTPYPSGLTALPA